MKKLYSTATWKLRQKRRGRKLERRRAASAGEVKRLRQTKVRRPQLRGEATIAAPPLLSFKVNPEGSSEFVRAVREATRTCKQVYLDLAGVTLVTTEALAVLLACVRNCRAGVVVSGNIPKNEKAYEFLRESGFFEFVKGPKMRGPLRGMLKTRKMFRVGPSAAQELTSHVATGLTGVKLHLKPSYRMLIEAMANTREHAQLRSPVQHRQQTNWWAASAFDEQKREGYFACVDIGVGIFRSLQLRQLQRKLASKLGVMSRATLLREILRGRVESTTGLSYRGRGLPSMYEAWSARRVRRLVILSNDACADLDREKYFSIDPPFDGTIIAWEVAEEQSL